MVLNNSWIYEIVIVCSQTHRTGDPGQYRDPRVWKRINRTKAREWLLKHFESLIFKIEKNNVKFSHLHRQRHGSHAPHHKPHKPDSVCDITRIAYAFHLNSTNAISPSLDPSVPTKCLLVLFNLTGTHDHTYRTTQQKTGWFPIARTGMRA